MTYYCAKSAAEVFAAGAFSLAAAIWQPTVGQLVTNLIVRLGGHPSPAALAAGAE